MHDQVPVSEGGRPSIETVARHFTDLDESRLGAFETMAEAVLQFQRAHNPVYGRFAQAGKYLPVSAFKLAPITTFPPAEAERVFQSSGTGGEARSRHYVRSLALYEKAFGGAFRHAFGPGPFVLVAHLPHYTEAGASSSLLYMVERLVARFGAPGSGFFMEDPSLLEEAVVRSRRTGVPLLLFGAAFGLLDLVETASWKLPPDALVVETGGMKTYRREIGRTDLHARLAEGLGVPRKGIRSEYGMCELMSQCYTRGGEAFYPPPWMRFEILDPENPVRRLPEGEPGALAVLDLANLYSASAILTEDRAVAREGGFEVLGRLTGAELRGCNFLLPSEQREELGGR